MTKGFFPVGTESDHPFAGIGFSGQINYEFYHWSLGLRTFGTFSNKNQFQLSTNTYTVSGDLARRQFGLEAYTRYFLLNGNGRKRWYAEFGFITLESDFIHADQVISIPQSPDYARLFTRGAGFSIALGYRPPGRHFFAQLGYELDHYNSMLKVGQVNHLHQIISEEELTQTYFIHSVLLMLGVDLFSF